MGDRAAWIYVGTRTGNCIHLARPHMTARTLCHARWVVEVPKPSAFEACLICQSKARKLDAE